MPRDDAAYPELAHDVQQVEVNGHLILAVATTRSVVLVDPLLAVICSSFDGATSIDEIAADVAAAGGVDLDAGRERVTTLLGALERDGFLRGAPDAATTPPPTAQRRVRAGHAWIGLVGDATIVDPSVIPSDDVFEGEGPCAHIVAAVVDGALGRMSIDGRTVWSGPSTELITSVSISVEALRRALTLGESWLMSLALERDGRLVIVDDAAVDLVLPLLPELAADEIIPVPGGMLRVASSSEPVARLVSGTEEPVGREAAVWLCTEPCDTPEQVRRCCRLAVQMDEMTLDAVTVLVGRLPQLAVGDASDLASRMSDVVVPSPPAFEDWPDWDDADGDDWGDGNDWGDDDWGEPAGSTDHD